MTGIATLMTHDHRTCDESFARAETAASKKKWQEAAHTVIWLAGRKQVKIAIAIAILVRRGGIPHPILKPGEMRK